MVPLMLGDGKGLGTEGMWHRVFPGDVLVLSVLGIVLAASCVVIFSLYSPFLNEIAGWGAAAPNGDGVDVRLFALVSLFSGAVVGFVFQTLRAGHLSVVCREQYRALADSRSAVDRYELLLASQDGLQIVLDGKNGGEVSGSLPPEVGVPQDPAAIFSMDDWVELDTGEKLSPVVQDLIENGRPFSLDLHAPSGDFIRVQGRILGGYPVLSFRILHDVEAKLVERDRELTQLRMRYEGLWSLLSAMDDPVWMMSRKNGQTKWGNDAYMRLSGIQETSRYLGEILTQDSRRRILGSIREGGIFKERLQGLGLVDFSVIATPVAERVLCYAHDVAELERLKSKMESYVEEYRHILWHWPTAVALFGKEGRLQFHNASYASFWNLNAGFLASCPSYAELLDAHRSAGTLPEQVDYREWRKGHLSALSNVQEGQEFRELWHIPDGRTLQFRACRNGLGGFTLFYEDMTEKLGLESRYNALTNVQKETLDNLNEGVALFAGDGRMQLCNPAFVEVWSLDKRRPREDIHVDQLLGFSAFEDEIRELWTYLKESVTGLADARSVKRSRFTLTEGKILDCAIVPLPGGSTLVTLVDVTDTVRTESALRDRNEALEMTDRMRSAFVRHVSYVLRVPLNTIIGYTNLMTQSVPDSLSEKQREFAEHIMASGQSLLAIINDILDLATLDAGGMELNRGPVKVAETLRLAAEGLRDRMSTAHIVLEFENEGDFSDFVVDAQRLKQIVFNLLSNAVAFSHDGGRIVVRSRRLGHEVHIGVRDFGQGMDETMRELMFTPFESGYIVQAGQHRGPGLGLAIVRGLVELHGGYVKVWSSRGKGTEVTCVFPVSPDVSCSVPDDAGPLVATLAERKAHIRQGAAS